MAHIISPVGFTATALIANQLSLLVTYTEKLCRKYCINSSMQPQYNIVYTAGTPTFNGTTAFIPIEAVVTIVTPGAKGCCDATTQLFSERFDVAFQGQTGVPTAVTIASAGHTSGPVNVKCCQAGSYAVYDSITITITPAA